jgi:hypothetical protein
MTLALDVLPAGVYYHPQEKKAAVIRAEGESEAAKLISDATKSSGPGLLELRRIEVRIAKHYVVTHP